jgi:hypothetical protein
MAQRIGPYVLIKLLAQGGMAEVWAARRPSALGASQLAVVKRILRQHAGDLAFLNSFIDEARLSVRLNHPNIVRTLEVGESADEPYLAMELVDGADLEHAFAWFSDRSRPMPVTLAARIAADVLRALAHAHELTDEGGRTLDVVHRDVSPPNILLDRSGVAKLTDFGIAKARGRLTKTSLRLLKGKTPYMSPEQARAEPLDGRSDLFSLGAVLWECLAGRPLFESGDDLRNLDLVQRQPIPPPSTLRSEIEPALNEFVMRLLARPLGKRFASARGALAALEKTEAFRESRADEIAAVVGEIATERLNRLRLPTAELEAEESLTLSRRAHRLRIRRLVPALALVAAGVVALFAYWRGQSVWLPAAKPHAAELAGATLIAQPATPGAVASWDGQPVGAAPLARRWPPDGKKHELTLERPGYVTWRRQIDFTHPRTVDANVSLSRLSGRVTLSVDAPGPVVVAGRELAPGESMILPAGLWSGQGRDGRMQLFRVTPSVGAIEPGR